MGIRRGTKINNNGLVFAIDGANKKSYIGSGTAVSDLTRNSSDGTLINGIGFSNNSFSCDGVNDYIDLAQTLDRYLTGTNINFSIDTWVRKERTALEMLLSSYSDTGANISMYLAFYLDGVRFLTSPTGAGASLAVAQTNTTFSSNNWYNITVTQNGSLGDSGLKIYVNSILIPHTKSGTANFGTVFNSTNPYVIGKRAGADPAQFQGKLSSVKIYNRALTEQEILQNYNAMKGRFGI